MHIGSHLLLYMWRLMEAGKSQVCSVRQHARDLEKLMVYFQATGRNRVDVPA